jgi:hypothetical protein
MADDILGYAPFVPTCDGCIDATDRLAKYREAKTMTAQEVFLGWAIFAACGEHVQDLYTHITS